MMARRRYELLLPLTFNDGQPIPESLLTQTVQDLDGCLIGLGFDATE